MKEEITFTAKQVGERVKERRLELNLTMPELGKRIGVNKSTIQRYEADGVDPKRTMIINGLAEALLTTPEWLTGLSEEKEYDTKTLCQRDIESHIAKYLDSVSVVQGEPHQQLLTTFLGKMIDLYSVLCYHFADAMAEVDRVAADEGLKESLMRYFNTDASSRQDSAGIFSRARNALHRGHAGSAPDCGDRRCPTLSQQAGSHRIRRHRCAAVPVRQIPRE